MNFSVWSNSVIGKPFELGKVDCFRLVFDYLQECGLRLPEEYKGLAMPDYAHAYLQNREGLIQKAIAYMSEYLKELEIHQAFTGDILVVKLRWFEALPISFGIDGGNGIIISVTEKMGVIPIEKKLYNIMRVFRCQSR